MCGTSARYVAETWPATALRFSLVMSTPPRNAATLFITSLSSSTDFSTSGATFFRMSICWSM